MSRQYTHVLEQIPGGYDQNRREVPSRSVLSRWDDGMVIAARVGQSVRLGEDHETAKARTYRSDKLAEAALRKYADEDSKLSTGYLAEIEEIDCSRMIDLATVADITKVSKKQ